jgi:hypothetical protein
MGAKRRMAGERAVVDPAGKQALFSAPVQAARDQIGAGNQKEGREALYSSGPRQPGTVVIACSSCLARTRVSLIDVGVRLLSVSLWLPARRYPHWMRCPACHRHQWCAIHWNS